MMKIEQVLELGYTNEDILKVKSHQRMGSYADSTLYTKIVMIYLFLIEFGFNKILYLWPHLPVVPRRWE